MMRHCSRTACGRRAVATLTYNYADSTAVLGPLSTYAEPHSYDMCAQHAERLTAPRGWEVVRLITDFSDVQDPTDDLTAVADAVRTPDVRDMAARRPDGEAAAQGTGRRVEAQRLPGMHYPERITPLRRDVAAGGGLPPRTDRLRVLRDGDSREAGR